MHVNQLFFLSSIDLISLKCTLHKLTPVSCRYISSFFIPLTSPLRKYIQQRSKFYRVSRSHYFFSTPIATALSILWPATCFTFHLPAIYSAMQFAGAASKAGATGNNIETTPTLLHIPTTTWTKSLPLQLYQIVFNCMQDHAYPAFHF